MEGLRWGSLSLARTEAALREDNAAIDRYRQAMAANDRSRALALRVALESRISELHTFFMRHSHDERALALEHERFRLRKILRGESESSPVVCVNCVRHYSPKPKPLSPRRPEPRSPVAAAPPTPSPPPPQPPAPSEEAVPQVSEVPSEEIDISIDDGELQPQADLLAVPEPPREAPPAPTPRDEKPQPSPPSPTPSPEPPSPQARSPLPAMYDWEHRASPQRSQRAAQALDDGLEPVRIVLAWDEVRELHRLQSLVGHANMSPPGGVQRCFLLARTGRLSYGGVDPPRERPRSSPPAAVAVSTPYVDRDVIEKAMSRDISAQTRYQKRLSDGNPFCCQ
eukprot:m51a1_g4440 hypothetical protein (339) ;mRNA; f:109848-110986